MKTKPPDGDECLLDFPNPCTHLMKSDSIWVSVQFVVSWRFLTSKSSVSSKMLMIFFQAPSSLLLHAPILTNFFLRILFISQISCWHFKWFLQDFVDGKSQKSNPKPHLYFIMSNSWKCWKAASENRLIYFFPLSLRSLRFLQRQTFTELKWNLEDYG